MHPLMCTYIIHPLCFVVLYTHRVVHGSTKPLFAGTVRLTFDIKKAHFNHPSSYNQAQN